MTDKQFVTFYNRRLSLQFCFSFLLLLISGSRSRHLCGGKDILLLEDDTHLTQRRWIDDDRVPRVPVDSKAE